MSETTEAVYARARELSPTERLDLIDQILSSLDVPDPAVDRLWAKEAEDRLAAYRRGEIRAIPLSDVLEKYGRT
jgi:putative addiction module component (TIGR02574 family)